MKGTAREGTLRLELLVGRLGLCRLSPEEAPPPWASGPPLASVTWTPDELSIVCAEGRIPAHVQAERGWRCLRVEGPLELSQVGVVARLGSALARAEVPVFVLSTFDTDCLLVPERHLDRAMRALRRDGHEVLV